MLRLNYTTPVVDEVIPSPGPNAPSIVIETNGRRMGVQSCSMLYSDFGLPQHTIQKYDTLKRDVHMIKLNDLYAMSETSVDISIVDGF